MYCYRCHSVGVTTLNMDPERSIRNTLNNTEPRLYVNASTISPRDYVMCFTA